MNVEWARYYLAHNSIYTSHGWIEKVNKMSDAQVIAVYHEFIASGKIINKRKKNKPSYEQLTIFDYIYKGELI